MSFRKCPECGETNYYESGLSRYFDCGFQGRTYSDVREQRCGGARRKTSREASPELSDDAARYRLALLDAAHAADGIAADLIADGQSEHARRCAELAKQMRQFAGHTGISGDETPTFRSKPERGLVAIFKKVRPWR